jgi:hypothetical protein
MLGLLHMGCSPFFVKFLWSWLSGQGLNENFHCLDLVGGSKVGIPEGHGQGLMA